MASERIQRRIDQLLDEADQALVDGLWDIVRDRAQKVLALDPENADARTFLEAANRSGEIPSLAAYDAPLDVGAQGTVPSPSPLAPGGRELERGGVPAFAHPEPVEVPSSFANGRYAVKRFLGEGGKKKVYLAYDTLLDRDVAFALIKTEGLDDAARERITREAQAMGRLGDHPHIVTIYDFGREGDRPYLVLPLLPGGDVEGLIEKAPDHKLPLSRILEIAKAIARGLEFAHSKGVIHRDLKPGNVWLTADGTAKLGDFGLAVAVDRSHLTQAGAMVGTPLYMPPEQALGGEATTRADLYSLGAMLYEMVTGRPPFIGDDYVAIISQHINTAPVAPSWHNPQCPPALESVILRLLATADDERPASAGEVLAVLEAIDPNAPVAPIAQANPLERLARGVFVGRERELGRLRASFDQAFSGSGVVVMLVGEPGIGKTRTAMEVETYARMRGAQVLWGRAHEAAGAPPYWPWVQACAPTSRRSSRQRCAHSSVADGQSNM